MVLNLALGETAGALASATRTQVPPDEAVYAAATKRQDELLKPRGSLGRLETLGCRLSAMSGEVPPPVPSPAVVAVFAGDHGVLAQGVTPWRKEVTTEMVVSLCRGGAAINVLARTVGASVIVVDVGVDAELASHSRLVKAKVRRGTADLSHGPAMTTAEALEALDVGAAVARDLVAAGARCLVTGDLGIGNTTPSAAVIAALTGRPASVVTGRGSGIDDPMFLRKVKAVERGLARVKGVNDPLRVLTELGGLEIAALAGFCIGAAAARVPVVMDGVIALAALCVAEGLALGTIAYAVAGHRSSEPGASLALAHLGLEPLLDLGLRLGEGTGACLALPLVEAAARLLGEMATFEAAGVDHSAR